MPNISALFVGNLTCGSIISNDNVLILIQVQLEGQYYEMVLISCMKSGKSGQDDFLRLVRNWPPDLYNVAAIVNVLVEELLVDPENATLQRALATLFGFQKKYDKAMAMYLKLGHKDVFQLIRR